LGLVPDLPVLAVDDNQASRDILREMLCHWETSPQCVGSADEALAALDQARQAGRPFRLIVVDADMPAIDGFALCRRIKQHAEHGPTPVVMLTAANRPGSPARALEAGASECLVKPVQSSRLARAIVAAVLGPSLPVGERLDPAAAAASPAAPRSCGKALVVDDHDVNLKFARTALERQGYAVRVARSGREAAAAWQADPCDLVLMDVQMPDWDGLQATAEIRRLQADVGVTPIIIALTASSEDHVRQQCLASGMDAFLTKPFRLRDLLTAIAQLTTHEPAPPAAAADAAQGAPEQAIAAAAGASGATTSSAASPLLQLDARALWERLGHDVVCLAEIRALFAQDYPPLASTLARAQEAGDFAGAVAAAHALKGMVANFCAPGVQALVARAEAELRREQPLDAARLAELHDALAALAATLATLPGPDQAGEAAPR
jgi:CheY-like chemotaxis protein